MFQGGKKGVGKMGKRSLFGRNKPRSTEIEEQIIKKNKRLKIFFIEPLTIDFFQYIFIPIHSSDQMNLISFLCSIKHF